MKKFSLAALLGAAVSAQNSDTGIQQLFGIKQTGSTAGSGSETIQISNGDQTNSIQLVDGSGSDTFTTSSSGSSSSGFGNEVVITSGQPSVVRAGNGDVSATTILLSGGGGASSNDQAEMEKLLASMRSQASVQLPSQQTQEFQVNTVHVLNQAAQNSVSAQSPFDSTFVRFATVDEMDMLILTGDITAIIKLIQTVAMDNSVPCDKKIAYLLELLGRLRTAVQKKSKLSLKLKLVIQTSINEINKLQIQLEDSRKALNQLGLDDLKNSSKRINKQLEDKYAAFNDVQGQIPVLQAQLLGTERQIDILTKNSENQRSRIGNDQLKLVQMRSEIGKIQTRLSQLLDIESAIKDRLSKSDQATSGNSGRITELRAKITSTQADLKRLKQDYDQANSAVKDQQVKVERIRTDIAVAETKRDKYLRQIMSFEDKINIEKKKNSTENLNKLTEMINSLKGVLPSVSSAIDKHYYNCYGAGNVKTQKVGDVTVYIVSAAKIADYLKSVYGSTIKVPNLNGDISFNRVDIFGSGWTGKYGYPFPQNAFGNQDFSFSNSFSCMNSNSPATGYGTITAIGSDYMEAQDEKGAKRKLILGSCSRLESTQAVPKIGQTIYYWADVGSRGSNLYQASCFG